MKSIPQHKDPGRPTRLQWWSDSSIWFGVSWPHSSTLCGNWSRRAVRMPLNPSLFIWWYIFQTIGEVITLLILGVELPQLTNIFEHLYGVLGLLYVLDDHLIACSLYMTIIMIHNLLGLSCILLVEVDFGWFVIKLDRCLTFRTELVRVALYPCSETPGMENMTTTQSFALHIWKWWLVWSHRDKLGKLYHCQRFMFLQHHRCWYIF